MMIWSSRSVTVNRLGLGPSNTRCSSSLLDAVGARHHAELTCSNAIYTIAQPAAYWRHWQRCKPFVIALLSWQDELSKEFSRMLVAADQVTDHALGYIVGWHVAGELQVRQHTW